MGLSVMDAGSVLRPITGLKALDGGVLRRMLRAKVMHTDGVTLLTVATFVQPLTATATFTSTYIPVAFNSMGMPIEYDVYVEAWASPVGGLGPYTYLWEFLSGTGWTLSGSTTASPTFSGSNDSATTANVRVTISDASGQSATATITIP